MLLSALTPLQQHTCIRSVLCILSIKSNSFCALHLSFISRMCFLSSTNMSQWGHWGVSHRLKPASWSNNLHFYFCLSWPCSGLSRVFLISLFVFHQCRLFLENRPLRMCELRSCFGGISSDQGSLKLSELISGHEWPQSTVPGRPHTVLWQVRRGWQEARAVVGSSQSKKTHKTRSTP